MDASHQKGHSVEGNNRGTEAGPHIKWEKTTKKKAAAVVITLAG